MDLSEQNIAKSKYSILFQPQKKIIWVSILFQFN